MSDDTEILNDHEAAKFLKCGRTCLRKAARRGEVPCRIIGGKFIFSRTALLNWVAAGQATAPVMPRVRRPSGVLHQLDYEDVLSEFSLGTGNRVQRRSGAGGGYRRRV